MTDYTIMFNKSNKLEHLQCTAASSKEAMDRLLNLFPSAKIIEVRAEKPNVDVSTIVYINNVIRVDFKNKRRVA